MYCSQMAPGSTSILCVIMLGPMFSVAGKYFSHTRLDIQPRKQHGGGTDRVINIHQSIELDFTPYGGPFYSVHH